MRRGLFHLFLSCLLLLGCQTGEKGRVIPKSDMKNIYADLFLADAWLSINNEYDSKADTTLFYEPIFNKYGYTSRDFRRSVNFYLKDPVRYSRILAKTIDLLDSRRDIVEELMKDKSMREKELLRLASFAPQPELFPMAPDVPIEIDSVEYTRDTSRWYLSQGPRLIFDEEKDKKTKIKNGRHIGEIRLDFE